MDALRSMELGFIPDGSAGRRDFPTMSLVHVVALVEYKARVEI